MGLHLNFPVIAVRPLNLLTAAAHFLVSHTVLYWSSSVLANQKISTSCNFLLL